MVGLLKTDPPEIRNPGRREPAQNVLVSIRPHRLALAATLVSTGASAQPRPSTVDMRCAQAGAIVAARGAGGLRCARQGAFELDVLGELQNSRTRLFRTGWHPSGHDECEPKA